MFSGIVDRKPYFKPGILPKFVTVTILNEWMLCQRLEVSASVNDQKNGLEVRVRGNDFELI